MYPEMGEPHLFPPLLASNGWNLIQPTEGDGHTHHGGEGDDDEPRTR